MYSFSAPMLPVSFEPCFPSRALPKIATDYVYGLANEIGTDPDMVAITSLAVANSLLFGASCEVRAGFTVGSSLYFAIGAPPSLGKTPCVERLLRVYNSLIEKHFLLSNAEKQNRLSKQELLRARSKQLLKMAAKEDEEDRLMMLVDKHAAVERKLAEIHIPQTPLMGQTSLYAFIKELAIRDGVGVNIDAEGGIFAAANSVVKEQLRPLLKAWSSEELTDVTKKASYRIESPTFTIAALWQDKPLKQFLREPKYYDIGLVARVLPYLVKRNVFVRRNMLSQECEQQFVNLLERILVSSLHFVQQSDGKPRFSLSYNARECLRDFKIYSDQLRSPNGMLSEYPEIAGKMDVQAVKLAMVLHVLDEDPSLGTEISGETMERACRLVSFFSEELVTILGSAQENAMIEESFPLIDLLVKWDKTHSFGTAFTIDQLKRPIGFSKTKCDRILFWLSQRQGVYRSEQWVAHPDGKRVNTEFWQPNSPVLRELLG